ncbi:hypothetical protein GCM10029992_18860 [Glycomyces albus]
MAALLTGTVAVSGVSAASGDALPGETLYNVKRSTEKAQLALAGNDLGRAQLHLEFARTRIAEAGAVSGDDEAVQRALEDAATELLAGVSLLGELAVESGDPAPLDYVDLFTNEQRGALEGLVGGLGEETQAAGDELIELMDAAAVRSVELREALACTSPGGSADELGPVPGECGSDYVDRPAGSGQDSSGAEAEQTESAQDPSGDEPSGSADDAGGDDTQETGGSGEESPAPRTPRAAARTARPTVARMRKNRTVPHSTSSPASSRTSSTERARGGRYWRHTRSSPGSRMSVTGCLFSTGRL